MPIEHGMVTRAIERAQKQVEAHNFDIRKHLLEYDDVMNKQRESDLHAAPRDARWRRAGLGGRDLRHARVSHGHAEEIVDGEVDLYAGKETDADSWDIGALKRELSELFALDDADYGAVPFGTGRSARSAMPCGSGSRRSTSRRSGSSRPRSCAGSNAI